MGALIPLALTLAPELARWLFGPSGAATAATVVQAVQAVAGTADEAQAKAMIAADPAAAATLRIRLAEIAAAADQAARAAELDTLRAQLADIAGARGQTVALAQAGSAVQWAPVLVSVTVLAVFAVGYWQAFNMTSEATAVQIGMVEILKAAAISVVSYWVGSSAGSAQKTDLLAKQTVK